MGQLNKPDLLFVLSVDTEEEWDWSGPLPEKKFSTTNVRQVPAFQEFCQGLGIRPTYFVDYAVAENEEAKTYLKPYSDNHLCEIGAHLHPWCNPPYFGPTGEKESHVVNLPAEQVEAKLDQLIEKLQQTFGIYPGAFRTGRWGINRMIFELLEKKGIHIDSSMYPFYHNDFFDCRGTSLNTYYPNYSIPNEHGTQRNIIEFPVTVGFNWPKYRLLQKIYDFINKPALNRFRLIGLFWHTKLLRKLYWTYFS